MADSEYQDLQPGPALDRRAADVVMGWTDWRDHAGQPAVKPPGEDSREFKPSLNTGDAFVLVDKVLQIVRGQFRLQRGAMRFTSVTFFGKHNDEELIYAHAVQSSEALAICSAAIQVMEDHAKLMKDLWDAGAQDRLTKELWERRCFPERFTL